MHQNVLDYSEIQKEDEKKTDSKKYLTNPKFGQTNTEMVPFPEIRTFPETLGQQNVGQSEYSITWYNHFIY